MTKIPETISFESIQSTAVYQHDAVKSDEVNKLIRSLGVGSNFLSSNFDMTLTLETFGAISNLYAQLTPGIFVQDNTVINFEDHMPKTDNINIKLWSTSTAPGAGAIYYIGSQYYHGTYGDGINAKPTYATIIKTQSLTSFEHFVPFYKIKVLDGYSGVTDITNLQVERVIPHLKYNGCGGPVNVVYVAADDGLKIYGDDRDTSDDALIWSLIF